MTKTSQNDSVVLVADTDERTLSAIRSSLEGSIHTLIQSSTVSEMLDLVERHQPALVVCELHLADGSGFSLCAQLRLRHSAVRVLVISRWAQEADRILAFECGADDFLTKPFYCRELQSRIHALLRRGRHVDIAPPPALDGEHRSAETGITIDPNLREVRISGRRLPLTPSEFSLLQTLVEGNGRVFGRSELVSGSPKEASSPGIRSIDAHIKSIRKKLGAMGPNIKTVHGVGYRYSGIETLRNPRSS
jgi:DNA-binding response OmpR family regulator